jgi:putative transposase
MSELRKADFDGLFFVTLTVVGWVDVFSRSLYTDIVVKNLQYCQREKSLELYAYVIMTNHLHMIAAQKEGNLQEVLGRFKSFTAKEILKAIEGNEKESRKDWLLHMFHFHARLNKQYYEYHFWQSINHPTAITGHEMLMQKVKYTQLNPVRAGYVREPDHWYYSSANPLSPLKVLEI